MAGLFLQKPRRRFAPPTTTPFKKRYTALLEENLLRAGGILLSDEPLRLILVQAALAREGRIKDFVPLETASLKYPFYHKFLHGEFPQKWPDTVTAAEQTNGVGPQHLIGLLAMLAKTNELYYLHPSFGYYFEEFYLEPHGLIYKLKMLPNDTLLPPPLDKNQIAENEEFWAQAEKLPLSRLNTPSRRPTRMRRSRSGKELLAQLYVERETKPECRRRRKFLFAQPQFLGRAIATRGRIGQSRREF